MGSSRRGSEFQNVMSKNNKNVSSWLNKNDDDVERDDIKTPVNQTYTTPQASTRKSEFEEKEQKKPVTTDHLAGTGSDIHQQKDILVDESHTTIMSRPESKVGKESDSGLQQLKTSKPGIKADQEKKQPSRPRSKLSNESQTVEAGEKSVDKTIGMK